MAHIDGPAVIMTYIAEDKAHVSIDVLQSDCLLTAIQKEPVEALLRSMLLVLMDNASAEYTFVTTFFATDPRPPMHSKDSSGSIRSPPSLLSPTIGEFEDIASSPGSDFGGRSPRQRVSSIGNAIGPTSPNPSTGDEQAALNSTWKQIMEPVLQYCQVRLVFLLYVGQSDIGLIRHSSTQSWSRSLQLSRCLL